MQLYIARLGEQFSGPVLNVSIKQHFRRGWGGRLFVKDPFCLFISSYMVESFDAKVVITIRHPGALVVSMRRMGWSPHIKSLALQPGLMKLYLPEFDASDLYERSAVDDIFANAVFWLASYRFSRALAERFPNNVFLLRHEDISLGKFDVLEKLLTHMGIAGGFAKAASFIQKTTSGNTVVPAAGVLA